MTKLLDEGYLDFVESWGSDERIIEAARMSTDKGFLGWGTPDEPGDERLLSHLYRNNHATPFEMGGMVIEVKAPLFVFREWHRHRCVSGDTLLHFNQKRNDNRVSLHKDSIANIFRKFHAKTNGTGFPIQGMALRSLSENGHDVSVTNITNVFESGEKSLYKLTLENGNQIKTTKDHRFQTPLGWFTLEEIMDNRFDVLASGTNRNQSISIPLIYTDVEEWRTIQNHPKGMMVSSHGRIFNPYTGRLRKLTIQPDGYVRFTDSRNNWSAYVHVLVCTAFNGLQPSLQHEVSHKDHNRGNNHPLNLEWTDHKANCLESQSSDRHSRLCAVPMRIVGCEPLLKKEMTYDLSVSSPLQNFIAEGFVIHNSQSYNEMSARYVPLPDEDYMPTIDRVMTGANTATTNKQAQGTHGGKLQEFDALEWLASLQDVYNHAQGVYERGLAIGIPKELARLPVPVARYSKMRACANLRNWIGFLKLRQSPQAQWEIRVYADAVADLIKQHFPRTWELYNSGR